MRSYLEGLGITLPFTYTNDFLANVHGGIKTGAVGLGIFQPRVGLDLQKLLGWEGDRIHIHGLVTHGPFFSPTYSLRQLPCLSQRHFTERRPMECCEDGIEAIAGRNDADWAVRIDEGCQCQSQEFVAAIGGNDLVGDESMNARGDMPKCRGRRV